MANILHKGDLPAAVELKGDLAIDTETMGLNTKRDRLCLVQMTDGQGDVHLVQLDAEYNAPNLKKVLSNSKGMKIFHFARFDVAAIKYYLGVDFAPETLFCTKIASKLARTYTDKHGLKELCRELMNKELSKQKQSSYWGAEDLGKEQIAYAASDVLYLHGIRDQLTAMLEENGRLAVAQKCFAFIPARVELDLLGWSEEDIFRH